MNSSLRIYLGNCSSVDDQTLIKYCSSFGRVRSCTVGQCPTEKRSFCDFRLLEFVDELSVERFLGVGPHRIGNVLLDVHSFDRLVHNFDLLNIDRKLFLGPIGKSTDVQTIVEFYRTIDPHLQHCLTRSASEETFVLLELTNRQLTRTILERRTSPDRIFDIHPAVHPKDFLKTRTPAKNHEQCQIFIEGLNEKTDEKILTDYFDKRASVVSCRLLPGDRRCAVMEFDDETCVRRLLSTPCVRLCGANLSLKEITHSLLPLADEHEYNNEQIDQLLETLVPPETSIPQAVASSSSDVSECGWTSPPRTVISRCLSMDQRSSPDPPRQVTETKPSKSIAQLFDEAANDFDRLKDEYRSKFTEHRRSIEREINQIINQERTTLEKFHRPCPRQSTEHKRKYTEISSND